MTTFTRQKKEQNSFHVTTHVCDRQLQREQQAEEQEQKQATQMLVLSHEIVSKTT